MTGEGVVYTVMMFGKDYYYLPTRESWTLDMRRISLGDIYFSGLAKAYLGSPSPPDMKEFPELPEPDKTTIKISIG